MSKNICAGVSIRRPRAAVYIHCKLQMNTAEVESVTPPISFDTHHDDVIHDAKVDFYGRRLATASSDRTVRIFQINENETETLLSILSGHEGPVWQVAWAHPKFGSILASCSYDGSVIIWQEDKQQKSQNPAGTHSTWTKIKVHRAHDSSVNSISFAPHAYGLHLACASSDGKVSILSQVGEEWQSQIIPAHSTGCNSVSWAPSAVPSSLFALNFKALDEKPIPIGSKMIATGGCDNNVKLWKAVEEEGEDGIIKDKWQLDATLEAHNDWVRDVCWRPSLGQTGNMLVSCSQDKTVLIWKLNEESKKWESNPLKQQPFPDTLWRVSFSEYGHLLAVSCGDNSVTIWKENFDDGTWELAGNVNETVTETVKIEEPLAVVPPPSAPVPEINFTSSRTPKIASDVGYMKPMSPMMPLPSSATANATPGYQQYNQAYDEYQNAMTPNIPTISQPLLNSGILETAVIPESSNVITDQYSTGYAPDFSSYEQPTINYEPAIHNDTQQDQQYNQYTETIEEFNKDIGFMTLNETQQPQDHQTYETYEQPNYEQSSYDQYTYDQVNYEQTANEQANYEQVSYDAQYEPQAHDQYGYDQQAYGEQTQFDNQASYDQTQFDNQVNYDQSAYDQAQSDNQVNYDQSSYDQAQVNCDQSAYDQAQVYNQTNHDQSTYEQVQVDNQTTYDQSADNQDQYGSTYDQATYDYQSTYDQIQYETQDQGSYYPENEVNYYQGVDGQAQQEPYNAIYAGEATEKQVQPEQDQAIDYTLQYEGYNPSATAFNDDAARF